jgi:Coenzyme PQQ synthesis protein D (PqqD)
LTISARVSINNRQSAIRENKMNRKLYVARSPRIAARMLGEEMLVMSGQGSTLFTLNPTATILWQAADGATPLDEIVERRICAEFEVKPEDALRDAEALAEDLAKHGILVISEQPIASTPVVPQEQQQR